MLELAVWPNPILKQKAKLITVFDEEIEFMSRQMFKKMYAEKGIGLAAPQVHYNKQMLVMDCGNNPIIMLNPRIVAKDETLVKMSESCLSFPGFLVDIERPESIAVSYNDLQGNTKFSQTFFGLEARCAQHEIDHLDGITFLKYISSLHRNMIQKKLEKKRG